MGVYYDLGRPVVGGWMGGGWVSRDPVRKTDLLWGGEFGQEGAVLFAVDVDTGLIVERHRIGAREFAVTVQHETGKVWIHHYHGLNQPGNLLQSWDPETRRITSHGFPPLSGHRFVGGILGNDRRIYLGTHPYGHLVSFDPVEEAWRDHGCLAPEPIIPGQHIWCYPRFVTAYGDIVCTITRERPGQTIAFNPSTGRTALLADMPDRPPPKPTGTERVITADVAGGKYAVDGETRRFHYRPGVATDICGLNRGPDGKIYGSTIISMHLFSFDPETRVLKDLGRVGWSGGEVYNVIPCKGKLYMGSYTGAYWAVYDPGRPWNPRPDAEGNTPDANPHCFGPLGRDMNRPFEYVVGPDGRIYIACRANYGIAGGGMGCFDPETVEMSVYRDETQSVQSVAADDRYVYGGTSISGGRGCVDRTTQAKLFMFDPVKKRRIYECIPLGDAIAITSLAVSPVTHRVYGTTDTGRLFTFDPDERQVIRVRALRSRGTPLMGVPETYGVTHLTAGKDGDIYGVTREDVFKLDVNAGRLHYLDPPPIPDLYGIVEGAPGVFYIGARGHLLEYHLTDTPHYR